MRRSDEGDPYRDGGRLCPVLRGVMGHHMFHHCVFRHVLHKVRLLEKKKNKRKATLLDISSAVSADLKIELHLDSQLTEVYALPHMLQQ